jgi:hypothetical protein
MTARELQLMPVKLDDVYYFKMMKQFKPAVYNLAVEVGTLSEATASDKALYQAKLDKLATVPGENDEQRRMAVDLLCEFQTYKILYDLNLNPHWVEETIRTSPDIQYEQDGKLYPVEVKHINPPREEDIALSRGNSTGGSVNQNYHLPIVKKVKANLDSANIKFVAFNSGTSNEGTLYLYYSQSTEAQVASYLPQSVPMQTRIELIVKSFAPGAMDIVVQDINTSFN